MTQREIILKHFKNHKTVSSWEAIMEYGITKLNSVVYHLRQDGYIISSENKTVTTRLGNQTTIAIYELISEPLNQTAIDFDADYVY